MIFYWISLGLISFASLFIFSIGLVAKRALLIRFGLLFILLSALSVIYYFKKTDPPLVVDIVLIALIIGVGILFRHALHEVRKVVNYKHEMTNKNINLSKEFEVLNNELKSSSILLRSKAVLLTKDICYVKSEGPYTEYFLNSREKPEIDRNSLKKVSSVLLNNDFVQIYRSIIVNRRYIEKVENNLLYLKNGVELPVSDKYRKYV